MKTRIRTTFKWITTNLIVYRQGEGEEHIPIFTITLIATP
jgi:hypothetical protein